MLIHDRTTGIFTKPKRKWADLILRAAADQEEFSDVRLITLHSYYEDVLDETMNAWHFTGDEDQIERQVTATRELLRKQGKIKVRQFVEYEHTTKTLTICIDVHKIDDNSINIALDLLADSEYDSQNDTNIRMHFGPIRTFGDAEIQRISVLGIDK